MLPTLGSSSKLAPSKNIQSGKGLKSIIDYSTKIYIGAFVSWIMGGIVVHLSREFLNDIIIILPPKITCISLTNDRERGRITKFLLSIQASATTYHQITSGVTEMFTSKQKMSQKEYRS